MQELIRTYSGPASQDQIRKEWQEINQFSGINNPFYCGKMSMMLELSILKIVPLMTTISG